MTTLLKKATEDYLGTDMKLSPESKLHSIASGLNKKVKDEQSKLFLREIRAIDRIMASRGIIEAIKKNNRSQFFQDDRRIRWSKIVSPFKANTGTNLATNIKRRRRPCNFCVNCCVTYWMGNDDGAADEKVLVRDGELLEGLSDLLQNKIEKNKRAKNNWKVLKIRLILYLSFEQSIKSNWQTDVFVH